MTTDERLEKLERELSRARTRFRWLVVGAGLCVMSVAVIYAFQQVTLKPRPSAAEPSKEIRANNFVLEDANGKPRASLGMDEDGVVLRLRYGNGNIVNVKDFSYPRGKDISHKRGKDISHPCGKQISHPPSE